VKLYAFKEAPIIVNNGTVVNEIPLNNFVTSQIPKFSQEEALLFERIKQYLI
jgi:hypothetical protein